MADPLLNITTITLPAGDWTAIQCPSLALRYVVLSNKTEQAILMRSDPNDSSTEDDLPAGSQQALNDLRSGDSGSRIPNDAILIYMSPSTEADASIVMRYI